MHQLQQPFAAAGGLPRDRLLACCPSGSRGVRGQHLLGGGTAASAGGSKCATPASWFPPAWTASAISGAVPINARDLPRCSGQRACFPGCCSCGGVGQRQPYRSSPDVCSPCPHNNQSGLSLRAAQSSQACSLAGQHQLYLVLCLPQLAPLLRGLQQHPGMLLPLLPETVGVYWVSWLRS